MWNGEKSILFQANLYIVLKSKSKQNIECMNAFPVKLACPDVKMPYFTVANSQGTERYKTFK